MVAEGTITFLGQADNRVFVKFEDKGFSEYKGGQLELLEGSDLLLNELVTDVTLINEQILVSTLKSGIFSIQEMQIQAWEIPAQQFLKENRIHSLSRAGKSLDEKCFIVIFFRISIG